MNATLNTPDVESELGTLLDDLTAVQSELLHLLITKRDCMAAGDTEGMAELAAREEALAEKLRGCHGRRQSLLDFANQQGLPASSLKNLAESLPGEDGKLGKQTKQSAANMRLLQHHSLTNWVVAQRTLLHLSQMLEIIATGGRRKPTYGKKDAAVYSRGSLIDGEA